MNKERLSKLVVELRGKLSQREFARQLGVSLGALQGWEDGRSVPGLENLSRIASSGGHSLEDVLSYLDGKPLPQRNDLESVVAQIRYMPAREFAEVVRAVGDRLATVAEGQ